MSIANWATPTIGQFVASSVDQRRQCPLLIGENRGSLAASVLKLFGKWSRPLLFFPDNKCDTPINQ